MRFAGQIKSILAPWVIIIAIGIASSLLIGTLFLFKVNRNSQSPVGVVTAALTVIPAPTSTPFPSTSTPEVTATATRTQLPSPIPGELVPGAYVQITGTGGEGLRLREEPGLNSGILFLGLETEVFLVQEGPQESDGYLWWYLIAPFDESRRGWAATNYLQVVQNP
ncbi:MAG: hypothetical protein PVG14_10460 [Anaerolineales bacterium]|jgi:hypothetical protein